VEISRVCFPVLTHVEPPDTLWWKVLNTGCFIVKKHIRRFISKIKPFVYTALAILLLFFYAFGQYKLHTDDLRYTKTDLVRSQWNQFSPFIIGFKETKYFLTHSSEEREEIDKCLLLTIRFAINDSHRKIIIDNCFDNKLRKTILDIYG